MRWSSGEMKFVGVKGVFERNGRHLARRSSKVVVSSTIEICVINFNGYDYLQTLDGSKKETFYIELEGLEGTYQAPLKFALLILKNGRGEEVAKRMDHVTI